MNTPESLNNNLLFLAGQLSKKVYESVTNAFREKGFDITVEQFEILSVLWYQEGINQQYLANELDKDKTTIARIINNMVKKDLLVKVEDQEDLRNKRIYLTHKGKSLQNDTIRTAGKTYLKALDNLGQNDLNTAVRILNKALMNLHEK